MEYRNITITITAKEIGVEAEVNGVRQRDRDPLEVDPSALLCVQRLDYWLNYSLSRLASTAGQDKPCELADLQAIGWLLYQILLREKTKQLFMQGYESFLRDYENAKAQQGDNPALRLRLHLILDGAPENLATLPWEFLFIPLDNDVERGFFFSGERTELILTRYSPDPTLETQLRPQDTPLKILVIWSQPRGVDPVDPAEVQRLINQIKDLEVTGHITPTVLPNPSYDALSAKISEIQPHIVHYVGHGDAGRLALCKDKEDPDFDLKLKDEPQLRWITGRQFRGLFNQHKPRLVFLNACKGAASKSLQSLSSTARDLVNARIPAVVAMQYSISNDDAAFFAREFYEQLGLGQTIDEAVKAGRVALGKRWPPWEHPRFATPVLYLLCHNPIVVRPPEGAATSGESQTVPTGKSRLVGGALFSQGVPDRDAPLPMPKPASSTSVAEDASQLDAAINTAELAASGAATVTDAGSAAAAAATAVAHVPAPDAESKI
jgi:hypothetical protein